MKLNELDMMKFRLKILLESLVENCILLDLRNFLSMFNSIIINEVPLRFLFEINEILLLSYIMFFILNTSEIYINFRVLDVEFDPNHIPLLLSIIIFFWRKFDSLVMTDGKVRLFEIQRILKSTRLDDNSVVNGVSQVKILAVLQFKNNFISNKEWG